MEASSDWVAKNKGNLVQEIARIRGRLDAHREGVAGPEVAPEPVATLDRLCRRASLSPFERDVLLLASGVDLDGDLAMSCEAVQKGATNRPTFGLALAALPDPHWDALAPGSPLRRWRLVQLANEEELTAGAIRCDERVLHHLLGVDQLDRRLSPYVELASEGAAVMPSQASLAEELASYIHTMPPAAGCLQVVGAGREVRYDVVKLACTAVERSLVRMHADRLPTNVLQLEPLMEVWNREVILTGVVLLLDAEGCSEGDGPRDAVIEFVLERAAGVCILTADSRRRRVSERVSRTFEVNRPSPLEQKALWRELLADDVDDIASRLAYQFDVRPSVVGRIARDVDPSGPDYHARLWDACRRESTSRLDDLAERIDRRATWADLVLSQPQREVLDEVVMQVRHRSTVYDRWGLDTRSARGLGITTLFAGPSGTGKTLAAEVLAQELALDLFRIDLATVVNKYIGETEKNLKRIFDLAEGGGAILLFDEADALFGKRSQVKDSHDRHANIEVGYLLQRMETFRGLAILTTNLWESLDAAFLRRLRFIVHFSFPDVSARERIWRQVFPPNMPVGDLDTKKLARLNVSGGSIRNIAVNSAFRAAEADEPLSMAHVLAATESEFVKLGLPLDRREVRDWA